MRIPLPEGAPRLEIRQPVVLHYQYVDWPRMLSKHRWYQAWEAITFPDRSTIEMFRRYHDFLLPRTKFGEADVKREWLEWYEDAGINMTSVPSQLIFWWDEEVLRWEAIPNRKVLQVTNLGPGLGFTCKRVRSS
jgi:hypothetical protein